MPPASFAELYHEKTKYTPEGVAARGRGLDFSRQPSPFKDYETAQRYDLTRYLPEGDQLRSDAELAAWRRELPPEEQPLAALSHLLYFTNGITGVVPYAGQPLLMRAAPSAGGLYPTEVYIATRGYGSLPDGLYNYQVRDHSLVGFWPGKAVERLWAATFDHPALLDADLVALFSGVFYRSAWRYEDRAYRRILLDTGHVMGNMALYAPLIGRQMALVGGFCDADVNDCCFFAPGEEGAIALAALQPLDKKPDGPVALAGPVTPSSDTGEGHRLTALHAATQIPTGGHPTQPDPGALAPTAPAHRFHVGEALQAEPLPWGATLGLTILKRRSTRHYTGEALSRHELAQILDFTYRPDLAQEKLVAPRLHVPALLSTYVVVNSVEGLDTGCYHYDPGARVLRQTRFTDLRDPVRFLALGQNLAGDAGAVVIHTADLPRAISLFGDRAYRYLHLDAGHLGQRLNLAAIRLNLGASGIGGFFDDQVNDMLGIPEAEAVLYLTTLGRPETDA